MLLAHREMDRQHDSENEDYQDYQCCEEEQRTSEGRGSLLRRRRFLLLGVTVGFLPCQQMRVVDG
jgi:hypothetical protein